jgi:hypothetical protein
LSSTVGRRLRVPLLIEPFRLSATSARWSIALVLRELTKAGRTSRRPIRRHVVVLGHAFVEAPSYAHASRATPMRASRVCLRPGLRLEVGCDAREQLSPVENLPEEGAFVGHGLDSPGPHLDGETA